jgi:hypothetical protein
MVEEEDDSDSGSDGSDDGSCDSSDDQSLEKSNGTATGSQAAQRRKERNHKRKKHMRRTAAEIERDYIVREYFKLTNTNSAHIPNVESSTVAREVSTYISR